MKGIPIMNIYDELRGGRTAEELVANFTAQLNEAEARIKAEEAEKARAEEENTAQKHQDFVTCITHFADVLRAHYPDLLEDEGSWSEEDYDSVADLIIMLLDLEATKARAFGRKPRVTAKAQVEPAKKIRSTDDIFADFFKSLGL